MIFANILFHPSPSLVAMTEECVCNRYLTKDETALAPTTRTGDVLRAEKRMWEGQGDMDKACWTGAELSSRRAAAMKHVEALNEDPTLLWPLEGAGPKGFICENCRYIRTDEFPRYTHSPSLAHHRHLSPATPSRLPIDDYDGEQGLFCYMCTLECEGCGDPYALCVKSLHEGCGTTSKTQRVGDCN